jgi:hypothetical protein
VYTLGSIAGLQQLTELRMGRTLPAQLSAVQLPPLLQQLDVTVELGFQRTRLPAFSRLAAAAWPHCQVPWAF